MDADSLRIFHGGEVLRMSTPQMLSITMSRAEPPGLDLDESMRLVISIQCCFTVEEAFPKVSEYAKAER